MLCRKMFIIKMSQAEIESWLKSYQIRKTSVVPEGFEIIIRRHGKDKSKGLWEVTVTVDDAHPDPKLRKTKEDLEVFVIMRFGGKIIEEYIPEESVGMKLTMTDNPLLKKVYGRRPDVKPVYNLTLNQNSLKNIAESIRIQAQRYKYMDAKDYTPRIKETSAGWNIEIGQVME